MLYSKKHKIIRKLFTSRPQLTKIVQGHTGSYIALHPVSAKA